MHLNDDGCYIFADIFPSLLCMSKIISNDKDSKLFITHFITPAQMGGKPMDPRGIRAALHKVHE